MAIILIYPSGCIGMYLISNTKLILGDKWFRLSAKLKEKRAQLARDPGNRDLIEEVTRLEAQLRQTERELDQQ